MRIILVLAAMLTIATTSNATPESSQDSEKDDDTSRKIIGSSVVTSVSVILNGEEPPTFFNEVGQPVPRPLVPPQVASPINLLNPDRYEFYTFNDNGDLIKRLMTMKEIQSIVAGGSNEGSLMHHSSSIDDQKFDDNVEDIVTNVQKVLNDEVEANKNVSNEHNILDTPDVSSSWSIILPAIFGNTGDDIRPHKPQIVMTPDAVILDVTEKTSSNKSSSKPSNVGSGNTIDDFNEKKTSEKPAVTEEQIVHITMKKPINGAFEASTPRSSNLEHDKHTLNEIHQDVHQSHSTNGYRSKTTAAPSTTIAETSTDKAIVSSRPTPSRFVTSRPPNPEKDADRRTNTTMEAPEHLHGDVEVDSLSQTKVEEMTNNPVEEIPTESSTISPATTIGEEAAEQTTIIATESNRKPEITEGYVELTTPNELSTENDKLAATTQRDSSESESSTEYSHDFDSKNSFKQIMESLKNDLATETMGLLGQEDSLLGLIGSTTYMDDATTTESIQNEDNSEHTTTDRYMIRIPSIDVIEKVNQSNVYASEEMFVDEKEPLVFDIPTTTEINIDTTEHNEETTFEDEDLPILQAVKLQYPESSSIFEENNPVVQQVDNFIRENPEEVADSLAIESVNNENKIASVVALENLTLSEFIEQAATVASILSNDAETIPIREIVNQLVLSPQLRNDEPELHPTTNSPAGFEEMESLSLQQNKEDEENVSYETSVIKETSSISKSSHQSMQTEDTKNHPSAEMPSMDSMSVASTEISVESDVHEVLNMVKMKMPTNSPKIPVLEPEVVTTAPVDTTEKLLSTEESVTNLSGLTTVEYEKANEFQTAIVDQTTRIVSEMNDDVESTTNDAHYDNVDRTTPREDIDLETQTATALTESSLFSGNIASDILGTIGMIDEDVIANRFNISINREEEQEEEDDDEIDDNELFIQSTTLSNEEPSTKTYNNDQTTAYNFYQETIENEIIKKLQETLEERLYPKTESSNIDVTIHTTEPFVETTTNIVATTTNIVATDNAEHLNTEQPTNTQNEDGFQETSSEKAVEIAGTTAFEVNDHTVTSIYLESSTQLPNVLGEETTAEESTYDEYTTVEPTTSQHPKDEETFIKLGETTVPPTTLTSLQSENDIPTHPPIVNVFSTKKHAALKIDDRTSGMMKPLRPHQNEQNLFYVNTPKPLMKINSPPYNTLKIKVSNSNRRPLPVKLDPAPKQALGLEESTIDANADILEFTKLCNELAFTFWKSLTSEGISSARSLVISPFALTSMLSMIFLGARGSTSGEMNEMLRLDDMVTFNPHLIFRNITDSVENTRETGSATSSFVRELFSDRSKGKILSFYKDKAQQFYSGHVEEVNFNVINDIIRRRTNLLVKRHTWGKISEYLKTSNIWLNPPLAGLSANIFQTDCSRATVNERDGEMFFQVLPSIRQRRLVPIPAAVYKSGFVAGYDPEIDATAVGFGAKDAVSTIFVMPGQQGHSAPGDNLERLESVFMSNAVTNNAWRRLLTTLVPRQGLEVQIPRFSHRSFINATYGLQKMGLNELFNFDKADLRGLTGSTTKDMYISDMVQINTFSTCGEDKIGDQHHIELYPAPPIQQRNINYQDASETADYVDARVTSVSEEERSLYDPLFDDQKYLELPLPLRPRQARIPEAPRLRFDKPFMYFVRHNPTGMILYMGRFNPRLLP